ncbi:hypothetical protein BHM03_00045215 [Ensete ventricosum]|nr:hypothetical protein BHM03_00045215 [Ensete ventricosum]
MCWYAWYSTTQRTESFSITDGVSSAFVVVCCHYCCLLLPAIATAIHNFHRCRDYIRLILCRCCQGRGRFFSHAGRKIEATSPQRLAMPYF